MFNLELPFMSFMIERLVLVYVSIIKFLFTYFTGTPCCLKEISNDERSIIHAQLHGTMRNNVVRILTLQ